MRFFNKIKENCFNSSNAVELTVVLLLVSTLALCSQSRLVGADLLPISSSSSSSSLASSESSVGGEISASSGSSGSSGQILGQLGPISGSLSASTSAGSGGSSSSLVSSSSSSETSSSTGSSDSSTSVSASTSSSSSSSPFSSSVSASSSVSLSVTPKPEGLLEKVKDMFKEGKEKVRNSVDNLTVRKSASADGSTSVGSSGVEVSASVSAGKSEGLIDKLGDMAKRGKEAVKDTAKGIKEEIKQLTGVGGSSSGGASVSGSINTEGSRSGLEANIQLRGDNPIAAVSRMVNKGANEVDKTLTKIEDKAALVTDKVGRTLDEAIKRPMSQVSGSGTRLSPAAAQVSQQNRLASERQAEDKSVSVEVLDKVKEVSKLPAEKVLRPLDRAMGYEKDPLIKMYDSSVDLIKKPIKMVSKPVESIIAGAFKTSDESRAASVASAASEQERREVLQEQDRLRRGDRTVIGEIADRAKELAEKPIEIILKPFDHAFGLDKNGKKNPLLQLLDDLYELSRKPVDSIARPLEAILKKMAQGEQAFQVSVRLGSQATPSSPNDPKLLTRLADGALNIADRVFTRPMEFVFKPLDYALGYDLPGKKNPILNAAHQLKNATRLGVELLTRPIDRILKEIADIGEIKDESERELMYERKRREASRIVHALDKLHEMAQVPWEIVLRPVGKMLGYSKNGHKEPLLRAWDVVHQVARTPLQVVSKPIEDALLGEAKQGQRASIKASTKLATGLGPATKNYFVEKIKKAEKLAVKPLDMITSPIRRLILGEDDAGKARGSTGNREDKIVTAIEDINNVALKPLEVITQPISDLIEDGSSKKIEAKIQGQASSSISGSSLVSASASVKKG